MLLAYDANGEVVAYLLHMTARSANGEVIGLVDFAAHEASGQPLRDIWNVQGAVGSGTWPEWIDRPADFDVELDGKRIAVLVHRVSGHRRDRTKIEAAIAKVKPNAKGERDIRHLVGGPGRPIPLDDRGRTIRDSGRGRSLPTVSQGERG